MSSVEDMGGMFNGATSFNGDLSEWDVTAVDGATSFNKMYSKK